MIRLGSRRPSRPRRRCNVYGVIRWLLVSWAANAIVLGLTGWLLSGVTFHGSTWTVILAAAVFGVLNTVLKPILKLVTLPLAIVTLGIAWLFVSMFTLWLTVLIVSKFDIHGFWNYVWATILIWALNMVVDGVFRQSSEGRTRSALPV
jgi:putative membrane protein